MSIASLKTVIKPAEYRLPPQNVEAEQCILGGILIEDQALLKVVEFLHPEDFYKEAHGIIYIFLTEMNPKTS